MQARNYSFKVRFSKPIDYIFDTKTSRNLAMRIVRASLKDMGLTRADVAVLVTNGIKQGRRLKIDMRKVHECVRRY